MDIRERIRDHAPPPPNTVWAYADLLPARIVTMVNVLAGDRQNWAVAVALRPAEEAGLTVEEIQAAVGLDAETLVYVLRALMFGELVICMCRKRRNGFAEERTWFVLRPAGRALVDGLLAARNAE